MVYNSQADVGFQPFDSLQEPNFDEKSTNNDGPWGDDGGIGNGMTAREQEILDEAADATPTTEDEETENADFSLTLSMNMGVLASISLALTW